MDQMKIYRVEQKNEEPVEVQIHPLIQTFDGTSGESRWGRSCARSSDAGDGLCCAGIY